MNFLLHKDIKEIANAQMAHLVFVNTQANASKNQKSHFFCQRSKNKTVKYLLKFLSLQQLKTN